MSWSWVDTEYSIHRVQEYTEYNIHRLQHTPRTASTDDCLSSRHSHDYKLTPECSFSLWRASLHDRPPWACSPWELTAKVSLSHSLRCELTTWWIESQHPAHHPSTASKYSSDLARLRPPSSHDHGHPVYLQTCKITDSKCISPNSLHRGLKVHLQTRSITASKCISEFTHSRTLSASLSSLDLGLQMHLQTRSIMAAKWISEFTRSRPPSESPNSLDHGLKVQLSTHTLTASKCNAEFTWSSSWGALRIADNPCVLPVQIYRV